MVIGKNYLNLNALFCLKGRAKGHFLYLDFKSARESGCNENEFSLLCAQLTASGEQPAGDSPWPGLDKISTRKT